MVSKYYMVQIIYMYICSRISGSSYSPIRQTYISLDTLMVDVNQLKLERTSKLQNQFCESSNTGKCV